MNERNSNATAPGLKATSSLQVVTFSGEARLLWGCAILIDKLDSQCTFSHLLRFNMLIHL